MRRPHLYLIHFLGLLGYVFFPFLPLFATEGGGGAGGAGGAGGTDAPGGDPGTKTGVGAGQGGQPGAAAVDVQAEIQKALKAEREKWNADFKEATGHASFDEFQTAQATAKGEERKLLEQRTAELNQARAALDGERIKTALLGAASEAVDPAVVQQLLAAGGKVENGVVTINGKSPADAVAGLLKEKPYLAKAAAGQGSGARQQAGVETNAITRAAFDQLSPAERSKFSVGGGKIVG